MKKKFAALIVLLWLVLPGSAHALETNELIALTAMPLAVAAVADLNDVPEPELVTVVTTLNRAQVPPAQFVEIVRYSPVAFVDTSEPRFSTYVTTQYDRGLAGNELAYAIANDYPTYGVREINVVNPPVVTTYVEREILPTMVASNFRPVEADPVALVAMPLAVAAVADIADVPANDLINVVTTLNRAAVPPTQFVEIVRYSPVAFVDTHEPRFATYVTTQYDRGLVGSRLAYAIADDYPTYGVREINIVNPPVATYVVERQILPTTVVTRFQTVEVDPLALVAMPLAVAAVSDMTDIPRSDLISFIASLNRARMPAPQFVEVVRYSPVMLVDRTRSPMFLDFVTTEIDRGIIGRPLAFAIADRYETIGFRDIDIVDPPVTYIVDRDPVIVPPVVVSHVRSHPHGGPPGQLKKDLGLQTGAEVVHGRSRPSRAPRVIVDDDRRPARTTRVRSEPRRVTAKAPKAAKARSNDRGPARVTKAPKSSPPKATRTDRGSRGRSEVNRPMTSSSGGGKSVREAPRGGKSSRGNVSRGGGRDGGGGKQQQQPRGNAGGKGKGKGKG